MKITTKVAQERMHFAVRNIHQEFNSTGVYVIAVNVTKDKHLCDILNYESSVLIIFVVICISFIVDCQMKILLIQVFIVRTLPHKLQC